MAHETTYSAEHEAPQFITFENNTLLPALFGHHDQHVARIEHSLGVMVTSRGNQLALTGPTDAVNMA